MKASACNAADVPMGSHAFLAGQFINQSLSELCSTLRLATPLITLVVTPFDGSYSIASDLGVSNAAQVRDIFYQPVGQTQGGPPLERTSMSRIDEIRARAVSNSYPMQFAISGVDTIELAPTPSDAGTLSVRVVQDGDQLAADSDSPLTVPSEFHDVVWLGGAVQLGYARRPILALAQLQALQARYDRRLGDLRSWLVDLAGEKPMRMQRRGDSIPNRDPSVYPAIQSY